jgi:hypothetical protein
MWSLFITSFLVPTENMNMSSDVSLFQASLDRSSRKLLYQVKKTNNIINGSFGTASKKGYRDHLQQSYIKKECV